MSQNFSIDPSMTNDRHFQAQLYKTYVNDLYSYGISLGFSNNKCMDAIHDIFYQIFTAKIKLDNVQNIKYYLLRSLKNRLLDIHKQERRISDNITHQHDFRVEVSVIDTMIDEEERKHLEIKVKSLMESLTSSQREAIYLRYMQEMEYEDIAKLLNVNIESVRKQVYRGLTKLRNTSKGMGIMFILTTYFRQYCMCF